MDKSITVVFNEIHREYYDKIFKFFRRDFSEQDTEDLTQQVFLHLWQWLPSSYAVRNKKALVFSIAKNVRTDKYRQNALRLESFSLLEGTDIADKSDFSKLCEYKILINKLPDKDKYLLLLTYQGYNSVEIAQMLNQNPSTIRSRLQKIRKKLK